MDQADIDELKSMIGVARKRALAFGICLGKKPENSVFLMHRTKPADVLQRQAKQAGETTKTAMGEVNAKGKVLILNCQDDPPAGLAKRLRMFLSAANLPMKVVIANAAGDVIEEDGEEPEDIAEESEAEDGDASAEAAAWEKIAAAFGPLVDTFGRSGNEKANTVLAAWAGAQNAAAAGKYAAAMTVAAKLKPLLMSSPPTAASASPDPGAPPKDIVKKRAFMVDRWKKIPSELNVSLKALVGAIPNEVPWEDPAMVQKVIGGKLVSMIKDMQTAIQTGFDADVQSGDGKYSSTRSAISKLKESILADELLLALRNNMIVDGNGFVSAFEDALNEIDTTLGA